MSGKLWRQLLLLGVLSILLSGCLRSASGGDVDQVEEQVLNSPTPPPSPIPTQEPLVVTQEVLITTTPDPSSQEVFPPQSSSVEDGGSEAAAQDVPAQDQGAATDDAAAAQDVAPVLQTATAIIRAPTMTSIAQTQTAEGPPVSLATNTPTQDPFATAAGPVLSGADCVHEVVAGENLFRLSMRYGVSIEDIARASGISNANLISVGQKLTIPGCGTTGVFPPPTSIPAGTSDGTGGFGTGTDGGTTGTGTGGGRVHVVQQYETLFELSLQYNVPINDIAAANGISNIQLIYIGQELVIP